MRKNTIVGRPDKHIYEDIFNRIKSNPGKLEWTHVERVLTLLSGLGNPDIGRSDKTRAIGELQSLLAKYRWIYLVSNTRQGMRAVLVSERDSPDSRAQNALRDLLVLFESDDLWRLRTCHSEACREWLFATKRSDKFCVVPGRNCRQRHYFSDPNVKAKKAAQMCEHRKREKARIVAENEREKRRAGSRVRKSR
jgi:hypothetical protein